MKYALFCGPNVYKQGEVRWNSDPALIYITEK